MRENLRNNSLRELSQMGPILTKIADFHFQQKSTYASQLPPETHFYHKREF